MQPTREDQRSARDRVSQAWTEMRGLWARHPVWTSFLVAATTYGLVLQFSPADSAIRGGDPTGLNTAVVTASAALAALGLVPMSIIVSMKSPRIPQLMRKVRLGRTIRAAVVMHLVAAVLAVVGIALDSPGAGGLTAVYRTLTVAVWAAAMESSYRVTTEFLCVLDLNSSTGVTIGELPQI